MPDARILVVEDEAITARSIVSALKRLGYVVLARVASGEEAIRRVAETQPDLVLMDIRLQGDMDGVEAARRIRSRFDIPVVYLTAHVDDDTVQRARVTQPFGYLVKPFQAEELHRVIETALHKHATEKKLKGNGRGGGV